MFLSAHILLYVRNDQKQTEWISIMWDVLVYNSTKPLDKSSFTKSSKE